MKKYEVINTDLPNRIRELRRKSGLSQEKFAELLNITQSSVSLYETKGIIPSDILVKISSYFNVSLEYLLKLEQPLKPCDTEHELLTIYRKIPPEHIRTAENIIHAVITAIDT